MAKHDSASPGAPTSQGLRTLDVSPGAAAASWAKESPHISLTIGSFDGVHLGHRQILSEAVHTAKARGGSAAVLTMLPHPREFFSPGSAPNLLTSHAKKLRLFEEAGIDAAFVLPFTAETAAFDPLRFIEDIVVRQCRARSLIVGHDFRFGRKAAGDYDFLCAQAARLGYEVKQMPPLSIGGERISSTLIREGVLSGELDRVEQFLGRKYSLSGVVTRGRGIGITLGFPTANIRPHHSAIPAHGVYAAKVAINDTQYAAAVNIGIAPTIRQEDVTVEAFVIDFSGDLIGQEIEIFFHKRLRPERKFPSHQALIDEIARDVDSVRQHFLSPP